VLLIKRYDAFSGFPVEKCSECFAEWESLNFKGGCSVEQSGQ